MARLRAKAKRITHSRTKKGPPTKPRTPLSHSTVRALNQRLLAPCKHTLLLLERQDVVQPLDVPVASGGTRAADTSAGDPLSASTLRRGRNVCETTTSLLCIPPVRRRCRPRQPRAQERIKPVVRLVLQLIPFRTTCRDVWETTQTWQMFAFRIYRDHRHR